MSKTKIATLTHKTKKRPDGSPKQWDKEHDVGDDLSEWEDGIKEIFGANNVNTITVSDNPQFSQRAQLKALWQSVTDPAAKQILKILIKDMIDGD